MKKINTRSKFHPVLIQYTLAILVVLLTTVLVIFSQLKNHSVIIANDTVFHYNRFFDIYNQIRTGHYNYFQTNFAFNQSGRIINAVYGPVFAYFNALLLFICKSWFRYQILSDFLINLVGGLGFFQLLKYSKVNFKVSLSLLPIFLCTGSMPLWISGTSFMGWSAAISPWILILGIKMVTDKKEPINWLLLALGMGLVAQIHLISTIILSLALLPFFIVGAFITNNLRKYLKNALYAVITTILLSANVICGLLVMRNNDVSLPVMGNLSMNAMFINNTDNLRAHLMLTVLIFFILQIILAVVFSINHQANSLNLLVTIIGAVFLLVSSRLFPWHFVQTLMPSLGTSFQAPYRLNTIAFPLLFLGFGLTLTQLLNNKSLSNKFLTITCSLFLALATLSTLVSFTNQNRIASANFKNPRIVVNYPWYKRMPVNRKLVQNAVLAPNLEQFTHLVSSAEPDYLPLYDKDLQSLAIERLYTQNVVNHEFSYHHSTDRAGNLILKWKVKNKTPKTVLPIVVYKDSTLIFNHKKITPKLTKIGNPIVRSNSGLNIAILKFNKPNYFLSMMTLSFISWIIFLGLLTKFYFLKNRKQ